MDRPRQQRAGHTPPHIGELASFRQLERLTNHWARTSSPPTYYWYVAFDDAPDLSQLVAQCQARIAFPYYDLTDRHGLHLTLDRIGSTADITTAHLDAIETTARRDCAAIAPFAIEVGKLGGTSGAVGFSAAPTDLIRRLRDVCRAATQSVLPGLPMKDSVAHPHVTIAYCNTDGMPATEAVAAVERLHNLPPATATISLVHLVLLERRPRAYRWHTIAQIPLGG